MNVHSKIFDFEGRGLVYGFMALKTVYRWLPMMISLSRLSGPASKPGFLCSRRSERGGGTVKISPPLCITAEAIDESVEVFGWIVDEVVEKMSKSHISICFQMASVVPVDNTGIFCVDTELYPKKNLLAHGMDTD